jgi:2-polyprenyl-3-methyl-5-hydroxy-6-metoxy-1,4-benzoquinol methylase
MQYLVKGQPIFDTWTTYQKIVANNYMHHAEIISIVSENLKHAFHLSVLDLGCGDSHVISKALAPLQMHSYLGVDTSEKAICYAKQNLSNKCLDINFILNDMLAGIASIKNSYDVILAGYSLHHYTSSKKSEFLTSIFKLLNPGGFLFLYDIMTRPGEQHADFNARACEYFCLSWTELTSQQITEVVSHVSHNDFPESRIFYENALSRAGFNDIRLVFRDKNDLFSFFVAKASSSGEAND